jgi:PGF-pre-PGF domain-containing protein
MHTGANITPNSGFTPDFTNPVTYTVTAEDKTDQKYTVTVNVAPNTAKEITSFDFAEIDPAVNGSINESLKTITLKVPHGTNVTALVPTIVHSGTNISPNTGVAQNFTNPVIYTVTDANSSTQNYTVSVIIAANTDNNPPATPTNSGGGGGGGGGTTGEAYENIEVKDVSSMFVNKDMSARFEFKNENNDIQYVEYDSLKNAGSISVTIECLKDRSTFADSLPAGKIYRNVNIWVGKTGYATPNNIVEPMIGFRVNNSWIENNNINVNSIVLNRYDGSWNKLPTAQTSFDNSYHYFETSTPGFSPFVITGDSLGSEENLNDGTENLLSTLDASLSELNSSIVNETQPENVLSALSGLISCLIISFVCFLVRKQ